MKFAISCAATTLLAWISSRTLLRVLTTSKANTTATKIEISAAISRLICRRRLIASAGAAARPAREISVCRKALARLASQRDRDRMIRIVAGALRPGKPAAGAGAVHEPRIDRTAHQVARAVQQRHRNILEAGGCAQHGGLSEKAALREIVRLDAVLRPCRGRSPVRIDHR